MDGLAVEVARATGVDAVFGARLHTDAAAAAAAASEGARAFTIGQDIYFGAGEYDTVDAPASRLIAHELVHVAQQEKIGPHLQRAPLPVWLSVGAATAVLVDAARGGKCTAFDSAQEGDNVTAALQWTLLPGELTLFGSEVTGLWGDYLARRPGDSLEPVIFSSPASRVVQGFRTSDDTHDYQSRFLVPALWAVLPDLAATMPADQTVELSVDQVLPASVLWHDVVWADPFDLPANIAGESGPSDAGPDTRYLSGSVRFELATDATGHVVAARVEPMLQLTVTDAIDFCPGNTGAFWQELFTIPMSRLEASAMAYDRPFLVRFDMDIAPAAAPTNVVAECDIARQAPDAVR